MRETSRRCLAALLTLVLLTLPVSCGGKEYDTAVFREKAELLRQEALADWVRQELGDAPAGEAGQVVFLSVSDGTKRANVWHASGQTLDEAWEAAVAAADADLKKTGLSPQWVKADLVYLSGSFTAQELTEALDFSEFGFFYYGAALDSQFETAFLESELNAASAYDYENGGIDLEALNAYRKQTGQAALQELPDTYKLFRTAGWFCGEDSAVVRVSASGLDYGRRIVEDADKELAGSLIHDSAAWLAAQLNRDGAIPVQFGSDTVDPAVHAQALSALLTAYRLQPDEALRPAIDRAASWLTDHLAYDSGRRAFLKTGEEFTLEGSAQALNALTEYMEVCQTDGYLSVCRALGEGILTMQDPSTGVFVHALDRSFVPRTDFRSASCEGTAVIALCRLCGLTGDQTWLDAAQLSAGHFIADDYAKYGSSQVALAMDVLTGYVPAQAEYYAFALEYGQKNLEAISAQDAASPAGLELLMAAYRAYDRMTGYGGSADGFHLELLLQAIRGRAQRQLDAFLFPEYAMYMEHPQKVLHAFMTREAGFAIYTGEISRHISGYALYFESYDSLRANGMMESTQ